MIILRQYRSSIFENEKKRRKIFEVKELNTKLGVVVITLKLAQECAINTRWI